MNLKKALFFLLLIPTALLTLESCNQCDNESTLEIGAEKQFFSVVYQDTAGNNYLQNGTYNLANVNVQLNTEGGNGPYKLYQEDLSDGIFGPFPYTTTPERAQLGVPYDYYYILQKDTFGMDTFRVFFVPQVDECSEYWQGLKIFKNGDEVADNEEIKVFTVTEQY